MRYWVGWRTLWPSFLNNEQDRQPTLAPIAAFLYLPAQSFYLAVISYWRSFSPTSQLSFAILGCFPELASIFRLAYFAA
jgi:hypothetical protein